MMAISNITKRSGIVVPFDSTKIYNAIEKAFIATNTQYTPNIISDILELVLKDLESRFSEDIIPHVENVQDIVEKSIADSGYFNVSKAYILYRAQKAQERANDGNINVIKRDGTLSKFDINEIENILNTLDNESTLDRDSIYSEVKNAIYDGIATKEINKLIIFSLRARIEREPKYSNIAARFVFNEIYKEILGLDESNKEFESRYRENLIKQIKHGIEDNRLDKKMLDFDFNELSKALDPNRDKLFEFLGAQVIADRYLQRDSNDRVYELPQYFWMRIAMGLSLNEKKSERTQKAIEFYNLISQMYYVPSTPTLFHAGTTHPQMSSCYLNTVQDDLNDIFKNFSDNAQLSKWSGGIGTDWTNVRGTGAWIKSTNVTSQGVIPFLKIFDSTTAAINRSGKRRGAAAVYLETWHWDIESFLELRKNTGDDRRRTHDTNTVNWIPDLFMKRVSEDGDWTLFSPDETPDLHHIYGKTFEDRYTQYEQDAKEGKIKLFKTIKAKDLWRKMITMLFETGHPWMTFKDPSNIRSPQDHVGVVHNSNLCTEITLNTSKDETAVCNLGSINLPRHIKDGKLDYIQLEETIKIAMRMLDNVIDLNYYPTIEAKNANMKHRAVGLGIMGLQDALYLLNLPFESEEAVKLSDTLQEYISYNAISSSSDLAKERGEYSTFKGSKWDRGVFPLDTIKLLEIERGISTNTDMSFKLDWKKLKKKVKKYGMRNSNTQAIAPTATISNISGCLPTVEPIYKNLYVKSNFSGEFTVVNEYLINDLKKLNMWNEEILTKIKYYNGSIQQIDEIPINIREKYKEVFEIDTMYILKHAQARGKWIDQSQSINIFTSTTSGQVLSDIYMNAWKMGLKTTYYLRTLGASNIEKSTLDINKKYEEKKEIIIEQPKIELTEEELKTKVCRLDDPTCEACQ